MEISFMNGVLKGIVVTHDGERLGKRNIMPDSYVLYIASLTIIGILAVIVLIVLCNLFLWMNYMDSWQSGLLQRFTKPSMIDIIRRFKSYTILCCGNSILVCTNKRDNKPKSQNIKFISVWLMFCRLCACLIVNLLSIGRIISNVTDE